MSTVVIGKLRYDIISDTVSFEKGMRKSRAELKRAEKAFRDSIPAHEKLRHERMQINSDLKKGLITQEMANKLLAENKRKLMELAMANSGMSKEQIKNQRLMARGNALTSQRIGLLGKLKMALFGVRVETEKLTAAKARNNAQDQANLGGSLGSALGFGGPGAGAGRLIGYGTAPAAAAAATVGVTALVKSFADVERAVVDLQILMGDESMGEQFVTRMREIAKTTPLTTKSLIANAQTLLAYGQSAEGLEETLVRLGTVAGGNVERFQNLTLAFAQVQSSGRLMGQEVLQLINAGFPLVEVAKAAGVEMSNFRKAVEEGQISSEHLTEALRNLTSEGGRMSGRLEKQAETVHGAWVRFTGEINEMMVELGERWAPAAKITLEVVQELIRGNADFVNMLVDSKNHLQDIIDLGTSNAKDERNILQRNWDLNKRFYQWLGDTIYRVDRERADAAMAETERIKKLGKTYADLRSQERAKEEAEHKKELERIEAQNKARIDGFKVVRDLQKQFRLDQMNEEQKREFERSQQLAEATKGINDVDAFRDIEMQLRILWAQQDRIRQQKDLADKEAKNIEKQIEADKQRLDAIKEDEKNRIKAINDWEKSMLARMGLTGGAPSGGQSFSSGSVEEYKFFAAEQKRRRENALRMQIEKRAADDTEKVKEHTRRTAEAIEQMNRRRQAAVEQLQGVE